MSFKQQLIEMDACQDAIDWVEDRTVQQAWKDCQRGDWMLWLLEQMEEVEGWADEKEIMLLDCWCARRALKHIPEGETRPLKAIEAKEKWTRGEITREEMDTARSAAWAVAWAAASTATYTGTCIATWASASATCAAAWAAACTTTIRAAVCNQESSIQADYIRTQFTPPKGDLCLSNDN